MENFRKAALERLASPEQIDDVLRISGAREWIALVALFILLSAAGAWAYHGSLPTKAAGEGVIVRTGGILSVSTLHGGMIQSLRIKVGDRIKANQVIAQVAQPGLIERIRAQRLEVEEAKRDRTDALNVALSDAKLKQDALKLQRQNTLREIEEIKDRVKLAEEHVPVLDQLLAKGLVTKQQTINARQAVVTYEQEIAARQAAIKQFEAQQYEIEASPQKNDLDRSAQIRRLEATLTELEKELALSENVVTPYGGEVIEMKVDSGSVVPAGAPILSLQPNVNDLEVVVCVPSNFAKDISANMDAEVSPSPVRREEYGFIRGKVVYVAAYPATSASLMRTFQNERLVESLMAKGPVTEVSVKMDRDATTTSGFQWSSSKGPLFLISSGTLASVDIITKRQRPISLVLPYLKKTVGAS